LLQVPIESFCFTLTVVQLSFPVLPGLFQQKCNVLRARVIIYANNHHVRLLVRREESFAFYFGDPDGNMIEVYCPTGDLSWSQPYAEPLDLSQPDETLLEEIMQPRVSARGIRRDMCGENIWRMR
jgi:hypothetical protein